MPIAVAAIAVGCTALGIAQDYVPALSAAMGKIPGLGKIKAKADGHAPAAAPAGAPGMPGMPGMPGIMGHNEPPKQQDSVSMSVNMNGNGAGGIRDLMSVLKNIEQGDFAPDHDEPSDEPQHDAPGHEEPIMGDIVKSMAAHAEEENQMMPQPEMDEEMGDDGETWANSAHGDAGHHVHGVDAITFSGDDMNSKGKIRKFVD